MKVIWTGENIKAKKGSTDASFFISSLRLINTQVLPAPSIPPSFKSLFITNIVFKTLLIEGRTTYNEGVLQYLGTEMIYMKMRKTMAGVALSLGLLLPVSGQALATNDLTNADLRTKATSIVDCSVTPFKGASNRLCMYSDNGSFANSFSRFGTTFYLKGKSGNYAYYESAR
ncbi:antimicrobial peptide LCI [Bacillus pumilus]|uniref:antimicrobial peptide LCI n=1 Tax=Bacillus pumilus TaxID=1408 RepID=UPI000B94E1D8|nr:antimicrobial peptide LCI [Bacillus pumilus]MCR4353727.1 antimicrobial peptide LCI [Bacillus pumilus]MCY7504840.1 antimicrobial peptide LCI [Bacillus pumilus]MED4627781.1 antimicrobial peptide LCI [Bacillus pumilus]MED4674991.1 antimicrobial peptide LCI [Bacillus pumilus]MED4725523.1 antimicrobial peptide LCI [Bacillus pumilus]